MPPSLPASILPPARDQPGFLARVLLIGQDLAGAEVGGCGVEGGSKGDNGDGDNGGESGNGKENGSGSKRRSRSSNGAGRVSRPIKAEAFSFSFVSILLLPGGGNTKRSRGQTPRVSERGRGADFFVVLVDGGGEGEEGSRGRESGGGEGAIGEIDGGRADGAEGVGACGSWGEEGWGVLGPEFVEGVGDGSDDGVDHFFGVDGVLVVFVVGVVDGGGGGGEGRSVGGGRGRHAADAAADGTITVVSIQIC